MFSRAPHSEHRPRLEAAVVKGVIVGDPAVGKSCLQLRFTGHEPRASHEMTIGVEFAVQTVEVDGRAIKIHLWDTAGQENFRCITRSYYRGAALCILVFDICQRDTFVNAQKWWNEVLDHAPPYVIPVLVGNKKDMAPTMRQVAFSEGAALASSIGAFYFETSAISGESVHAPFALGASMAVAAMDVQQLQARPGCYLAPRRPRSPRGGCCQGN